MASLAASKADSSQLRIDSTTVRTHQPNAGARKRSPKEYSANTAARKAISIGPCGRTTKIPVVGDPVALGLPADAAYDLDGAEELFAVLAQVKNGLADRAYHAEERFRQPLKKGARPIVPYRKDQPKENDFTEDEY